MVPALLIIALFTAAIPAWGGVGQQRQFCLSCHTVHYEERGRCSDCHLGNPSSDRKNIAHAGMRAGKYTRFTLGDGAEMKEGRRLMDLFACRRCHVSSGRGNRLAGSLDAAAIRKTAEELALSIKVPVANMPDFGLVDKQVTLLVNVVLAGSQGREMEKIAPVRVHFNTSGKKSTDVFSTKCGSCHRLLSGRFGAVGVGGIGPNLSGLFSGFYPKNFKNSEQWTPKNLAAWLKNPRTIRSWTSMQPVELTNTETKDLEQIIRE